MAKKILIVSSAPSGYRRALLKLLQGRNEFDADVISPEQLKQLEADPKLCVSEIEVKPDSSANSSGRMDANPSPTLVTLPDNIAVLVEIMKNEQFDPKGKKPTVDQLEYEFGTESETQTVKPTAAERDQAWEFYTQQNAGAE